MDRRREPEGQQDRLRSAQTRPDCGEPDRGASDHRTAVRRARIICWLAALLCVLGWGSATGGEASDAVPPDVDRSPVDLVLAPDESWLATANQTSDSVSLLRISDGQRLAEIRVGRRPTGLARTPDGRRLLVTTSHAGELVVLDVADGKLQISSRISLGFEPHGVAVHPTEPLAYVALAAADKVVEVDLADGRVRHEIEVGRWPRYLAVSPDGTRVAVGTPGDRGVTVIGTAEHRALYQEQFHGINIGHLQVARDNRHVYFPWAAYRHNQITPQMIRLGWVLGSRVARVRLDGEARREAISLDVPGLAVADPFGIGLTPDEQWLVVAASGTQELLVYRLTDLPLKAYSDLDLIDRGLASNPARFWRVPLGGRPMGLKIGQGGQWAYVANYLDNSVQVVDIHGKQVLRRLALGGPEQPSLARRGEAIFFDGKRSLDQWYSCHTCHYEGGTNAERMDTFNDGSPNTFKTVLPLFRLHETAPWTWHGWQTDLRDAMRASLTTTMLGPKPTEDDVTALLEYFRQLEPPPNPFRGPDGSLSPAAQRGERVFRSEKANCASCHSGPQYTDGQIHDVGLGASTDRYIGYNTPSLRGVFRKVRLLHDGRAHSLEQVLTEAHDPDKVTGKGPLTDDERRDLIEFLKTL
ncbi:MAG: c-type cytochrome [Pirellulales bacterium]